MGIVDFDTGTWTDKWLRSLDVESKTVFLYLWTNQHKNMIAMYEIEPAVIAFETGVPQEKVLRILPALHPKVKWDPENSVVWVVNHVRRQFMRTDHISPKIIIGIKKSLILLKGHFFVGEFLECYKLLNLFNSVEQYPYCLRGYPYPPGEGEGEGKGKGKKPKNNRKPKTKKKEEDFKEKPISEEEDKLPPDEIEVVVPVKPKPNEVIKVYCEKFKEVYGINPHITPKDTGIAIRLCAIPDIFNLIDLFFKSQDQFILKSKHNIMIFESQINKLLVAGVNVNYSGIQEWLKGKTI